MNKAAQDRDEDCYDPARKEVILARTKTPGYVGRTSQRPDRGPGKALECLENSYWGWHFGFTSLSLPASLSSQWLSASLAQKKSQKMWDGLTTRAPSKSRPSICSLTAKLRRTCVPLPPTVRVQNLHQSKSVVGDLHGSTGCAETTRQSRTNAPTQHESLTCKRPDRATMQLPQ